MQFSVNRGRQFTQDPGKTYEIDEDTEVNSWFGNAYQQVWQLLLKHQTFEAQTDNKQTCSAITPVARDAFAEVGDDSVVMGVSYRPGRDDGYISWQQNNKQSWRHAVTFSYPLALLTSIREQG